MNRTQARRVWEAARNAGVKPLSWRMYDTLLLCARPGGTHSANNNGACYALERAGLVTTSYPWATITDKGRQVLSIITNAAYGPRSAS